MIDDHGGPAVRRTTGGDWQALRATRLRAVSQDPDAFGSTHEQTMALPDEEHRCRAASGASVLAWWSGEPVGIGALVPDASTSGAGPPSPAVARPSALTTRTVSRRR